MADNRGRGGGVYLKGRRSCGRRGPRQRVLWLGEEDTAAGGERVGEARASGLPGRLASSSRTRASVRRGHLASGSSWKSGQSNNPSK